MLHLHITYTPTYPDELPEIRIEVEDGDLDEAEVAQLVNGLTAQAEDSLGMAMVYTLAGYLQESLAELIRERKERIAKAEADAYRLAEEVRPAAAGGHRSALCHLELAQPSGAGRMGGRALVVRVALTKLCAVNAVLLADPPGSFFLLPATRRPRQRSTRERRRRLSRTRSGAPRSRPRWLRRPSKPKKPG